MLALSPTLFHFPGRKNGRELLFTGMALQCYRRFQFVSTRHRKNVKGDHDQINHAQQEGILGKDNCDTHRQCRNNRKGNKKLSHFQLEVG